MYSLLTTTTTRYSVQSTDTTTHSHITITPRSLSFPRPSIDVTWSDRATQKNRLIDQPNRPSQPNRARETRHLDNSTIDHHQSDRPTYIHSYIHTDIPIPTYRRTDVPTYRRTDLQKPDHEQGPFAFELRNSHALTKRGKGRGPKGASTCVVSAFESRKNP